MKYCSTPLQLAKGLMFSKKQQAILDLKEDKLISLHMLFVFYPLYVYFINEDLELVDEDKIYPFTFYAANKKARYVVESPWKIKDLAKVINENIKNKV